ncbi:MAG: N-6 DNA methylase, partial [candidate division Zixibacteria bacterium]
MADQFNHLTEKYLNETNLAHRKALGQYFTPKDLRLHLLSKLPQTKAPRILDPACGSGEFLISAGDYFGECTLHGWEIDPKLVRLSRRAVQNASIKRTDSLREESRQLFDFVIGNPPYFEFRPDQTQREKYRDVIAGRANIFSMFVKLGLDALKPGGYLAYVIPPSMNNGAYFARLRELIIA